MPCRDATTTMPAGPTATWSMTACGPVGPREVVQQRPAVVGEGVEGAGHELRRVVVRRAAGGGERAGGAGVARRRGRGGARRGEGAGRRAGLGLRGAGVPGCAPVGAVRLPHDHASGIGRRPRRLEDRGRVITRVPRARHPSEPGGPAGACAATGAARRGDGPGVTHWASADRRKGLHSAPCRIDTIVRSRDRHDRPPRHPQPRPSDSGDPRHAQGPHRRSPLARHPRSSPSPCSSATSSSSSTRSPTRSSSAACSASTPSRRSVRRGPCCSSCSASRGA